jgi:hypothetical protein
MKVVLIVLFIDSLSKIVFYIPIKRLIQLLSVTIYAKENDFINLDCLINLKLFILLRIFNSVSCFLNIKIIDV